MIKSFKSKPLRQFAEKGDTRKLPVKQVDRVRHILTLLDGARFARDLDLPGLMFHYLERQKVFSVRVTGNFRITWRMDGQDVIDVDLEDYH